MYQTVNVAQNELCARGALFKNTPSPSMFGDMTEREITGVSTHARLLGSAGSMTVALKTLTVVCAVVALYYADLILIFAGALQSEATNYVLAIPFILAYFLYRKRKMLRAVASSEPSGRPAFTEYASQLAGVLLCAAAVILYWYGSYTFAPLEYHALTLPVFVAGLVLVLFNAQALRQLAFPVLFLALLVPPPSTVLYELASAMSVIASEASNAFVNLVGIPSRISSDFGNPMIIITRPDRTVMGFTLDIACSGIYPLMGFLVFAFLAAYVVRDKPWKKAMIFLLGLPLIYLLNVARITMILMIGYQYGEQLALQVFHLLGGLVIMAIGVAVLLLAAERLFKLRFFGGKIQHATCTHCSQPGSNAVFCGYCGRLIKYPRARLQWKDLARVAAVAVAVALLVSIQVPVFALTKGPAEVLVQTSTGQSGSTDVLPRVSNYTLSFVSRDHAFEQLSGEDASLLYVYRAQNTTGSTVWAAVEVAQTRSSLHPWETCLVIWPETHGYQPKVSQLDLRDTLILDNPPITARYFAFEFKAYNETQVVLYWYETSTFLTDNASEQKQVKISLISYPAAPTDVAEAEKALLTFAKAIAGYWQPIKAWTPLVLAVSQNGLSLTTVAVTLLACTAAFYALERRRRRNAKASTYSKLSGEDQQIIDAVWKAGEKTSPTLLNTATAYQNTTQTAVTDEILREKLTRAQENGLITSRIVSRDDEPVEAWKVNFTVRAD